MLNQTAKQADVSLQTGDLTVTNTPPTAGSLTIDTSTHVDGKTIPAGAYYVIIRNNGFGSSSGNPAPIAVNGRTLEVGEEIEYQMVVDQVTNTQKTIPQLIITNDAGSEVFTSVHR